MVKIPRQAQGVIGYEYHDIGASKMRSYEDRGAFTKVQTRSGLDLFVGIVADGVGGGNLGQRAAELTLQSILESLKRAEGGPESIPQMLGKAIGYANRMVYRESRQSPQKRGMSSTVAMAVIHNQKLYVANVGDSRVYLIRNGEIHQVTVDHTYANEKIRQGILTPEQAYRHPNAEALTRSVGFEAQIVVDLGLYLTGKERGREALKNQGLPLEKDDVIVVCSDGLVKSQPGRPDKHFVEPEEIVSTVQQYHAEEAAKVLVDLALGRNVDDNVTAVVMELPGRKIKRNFLQQKSLRVSAISLALLLLAVFLWTRLSHTTEQLSTLEQQGTAQAQTALAMTALVASYTPTPTITPRPPLEPGEIGRFNGQPILAEQTLSLPANSVLYVNHDNTSAVNGVIFSLAASSRVLFDATPGEVMAFVVFPGSKIFIENGRYAESRAKLSDANIEFRVSGSCMTLDYTEPGKITMTCYEGRCSYLVNYEQSQNVPPGETVTLLVPSGSVVQPPKHLPVKDAVLWRNALRKALGANAHAYQCAMQWIPTAVPPTPTPRPNNSGHAPTKTPTPTPPPPATPTNTPPPPPTPTDTPPPPPPPTPTPTPTTPSS